MARHRKKTQQPPRTIRHLAAPPLGGTLLIQGPGADPPDGRDYITRLTFSRYDCPCWVPENFATLIKRKNNKNVAWIPDTNIFLAHTDEIIWEALLEEAGRLLLAFPVKIEAEAWFREPRTNLAAHKAILAALQQLEPSTVRHLGPECFDRPVNIAIGYYGYLLGLRKQAWTFAKNHLSKQLGRQPTPQEISNFCKDKFGMRGQWLASKTRKEKAPEHRYNDELLVLLGIFTAICTGQETVILTRDEDVFEQFYKACWLLDTHYRSMLLADAYSADPLAFRTKHLDTLDEAFHGQVTLVEKPSANLVEILPDEFTPAVAHCVLIRERSFSSLSFCVEGEMKRLLTTKASTGGRTTTRFDARNYHCWLGDYLIRKVGNWAAIGRDITIPTREKGISLSVIDANLALTSNEQFTKLQVVDPRLIALPPSAEGFLPT
jgi:hypothetical protein